MLGLVTVMNQHIIETGPPAPGSGVDPSHQVGPPPKHDDSVPWSLCISVMKEVEVLTEMVAEHYLGKDKKWGPVASVEAIK
jgi:peroxin-16